MSSTELNPFLLAAATPDPDPRLLPLLRSNPMLASAQDSHGYSLLHAAASYSHISLLKTLVRELEVDVNLVDEDGETCLFVAESESVAKCLVEELGVDINLRNEDGLTARERIETDEEWPAVAEFLKRHENGADGNGNASTSSNGTISTHPPPLPPGMTLDINTTMEPDVSGVTDQEPDPEFRRRIEELAARDDFHSEEGQRELRNLVSDAVRGVGPDARDVRRKVV